MITNTIQTFPCPILAHDTIPKTPIPPKEKISKCAPPCLPLYSYSFPLTTIPPLCSYYDDSYIMGQPLQLRLHLVQRKVNSECKMISGEIVFT